MTKRGLPMLVWALAGWLLARLGPPAGLLLHPAALSSRWTASPELAVSDLAAGVAWALLLWVAVGWLAVLGSSGRGALARACARLAAVLLPRALRTLLEGSLGLSVLLSAAPAALAATPAPAPVAAAATTAGPLPSLDRSPVTQVQLAPLPAVPPPQLAPQPASPHDPVIRGQLPAQRAEVVVRRGDCLWSVVARALGPDADDAAVARAWPHWYATNRTVIGPDPGLLLPGQRLVPPPGVGAP